MNKICENVIGEEFVWHHILFKIEGGVFDTRFPPAFVAKYVERKKAKVIGIPKDLHYHFIFGEGPKDVNIFCHQFYLLQIACQIYDNPYLNQLLDLMIEYDDFDSYWDYVRWKEKHWLCERDKKSNKPDQWYKKMIETKNNELNKRHLFDFIEYYEYDGAGYEI